MLFAIRFKAAFFLIYIFTGKSHNKKNLILVTEIIKFGHDYFFFLIKSSIIAFLYMRNLGQKCLNYNKNNVCFLLILEEDDLISFTLMFLLQSKSKSKGKFLHMQITGCKYELICAWGRSQSQRSDDITDLTANEDTRTQPTSTQRLVLLIHAARAV